MEIYVNGEWGTVCDDGWDMQDASVVCKQLGFDSAQVPTYVARFGQGVGPIHFDDVECDGHESDILNCRHNGLAEHNCGHHEDAGVVCSAPGNCLKIFIQWGACRRGIEGRGHCNVICKGPYFVLASTGLNTILIGSYFTCLANKNKVLNMLHQKHAHETILLTTSLVGSMNDRVFLLAN